MNSRRSFFKQLALLGSASIVAPQIFIPKLERVKWKPLANPGQSLEYMQYEIITDNLTGLSLAMRRFQVFAKEYTSIEIVRGFSNGEHSALERLLK